MTLRSLLMASATGTLVAFELVAMELAGMSGLMAAPLKTNPAVAAPAHRPAIAQKISPRPKVRRVGGSRGLCTPGATGATQELLLFLPTQPSKLDLTSTPQPTLYFYVPGEGDMAQATFRLSEQTNDPSPSRKFRLVEQQTVALPATPGVFPLQFPKALESGKRYKWALSIKCKRSDVVLTHQSLVGYEALPSDLNARLNQATVQQQIDTYQENQRWIDAMALKIQPLRSEPTTLDSLLNALGLSL